jgi:hypothetical protein
MEPFDQEILRPRKAKWALGLLVCAVGAVICFNILRDPASGDRVHAYIYVTLCAFGALVSFLQLIPGSSFLQLTPEGFTVRTMWRTRSIRWSDIEHFGVAEVSTVHGLRRQRHQMVGYDFSASYPGEGSTLRNLNRKLSGFEASLPDNYGWNYEELADHLNKLKARFTGRS